MSANKSLDLYPILSVLFRHCTLNDLISFRQVSKSWRSIIDESLTGREELILFIETRPHQWFWFYEGKPINLANVINVKKTCYLDCEYLKSTFKNIKSLLVVSSSSFVSNRDFNQFVNHFINLKHLQINYNLVKCEKNIYHCDIKLDQLKTFYSDGDVQLRQMNCKNLVKLTLDDQLSIPENLALFNTIEYLNVRTICCSVVLPKLEVLVLQQAYNNYYTTYNYNSSFSSDNFPNLKELHVWPPRDMSDSQVTEWYQRNNFDTETKLFIEPHLSPYGLELDGVLKRYYDNLSDLDLSTCANIEFKYTDQLGKIIKRNKRLVQENGWRFKAVKFRKNFVNNEIFLNLSSYFTCIQFICINTDLKQEQLDLIPKFSPLVKKVTFSYDFNARSEDDYKFLCKLGHLKVFFSDDIRCFEQLGDIIENCEHFIRGESPYFIVRSQNLNNILIKDINTKQKQTFVITEELLDHITKMYLCIKKKLIARSN